MSGERHVIRVRIPTCQRLCVLRRAIDRVIAVVARVLALGFFRTLEVDGESRVGGGEHAMGTSGSRWSWTLDREICGGPPT